MGRFETVDEDTIRKGGCTDIYFVRSGEVLEAEDRNPRVVMEVTAGALPDAWAIFCGLNDVAALLEGIAVDIDAMPEGTVFLPHEPVLRITGRYRDFARYETAILGFLCHASGIASAAAHIRCIAGNRQVYSFGSRRQHPAIAPMVERSAWIGGVDGVSNTAAPPGIPLAGTMPHAFVMCYPRPVDAFRAFSWQAPPGVPRIMLCDTFCDEKRESLAAAAVGAEGVRLDTPRSRRGNMREILEEVRWELDSAGYEQVKIFLSGGVNREDIIRYRDIVDAFGVGGAIANAPVIDFAMDIVEREGVHCAKRGKRGGVKQVYLMPSGERVTLPAIREPPAGGTPLLLPFVREGRVVRDTGMAEARERVISAIPALSGKQDKN